MILNADSAVNDELVTQIRENETWEKAAKKMLSNLGKAKGCYLF